jgi:hypothetical protein
VTLNIAGSSAAQKAIIGSLQAELCGGASNALTFSSTNNKNFLAVSCTPASGTAGADGATYYTVYYRAEGGSVVGALPIVNNVNVNFLDLNSISASSTCASSGTTACTPTIAGSSSANGIDDSFQGALAKGPVQLGILDVEPAALVGNNYPTPYSTSVWGAANPSGLTTLSSSAAGLFGEVYGIFVNTGTNAIFSPPLSLSTQTVEQLLTKSITNWSLVTDVNGNVVTSSSQAVTIVNREAGSGSRTATDLLIAGDVCQSQGKHLVETKSTNVDYFATGDVLNAANSVAGAITYATIDNIGGSQTNLTPVSLNGVVPSNLAAASGQYPFWVEATFVTNANAGVTLSALQSSLLSYVTTTLQSINTAPHLLDVLAIPGVAGNTANKATAGTANTTTISGLGTNTIYVNPFTRSQVTCNLPAYQPKT